MPDPTTAAAAYVIAPQPQVSLPVVGSERRFPVNRVFCIGRNYAAHAVEMGHDPAREPPFFFCKSASNLSTEGRFPYPSESKDVQHEVELVVALGKGASQIAAHEALALVWGYGIGLDMTRRDLQAEAKAMGRPWEIGKSFENSAPCGPLTPVETCGHPSQGAIRLAVNGLDRQAGDLDQMIWKVPELIAVLSRYFVLQPGDIIMTGTPAGVAAVAKGDVMEATIEGLGSLSVRVV